MKTSLHYVGRVILVIALVWFFIDSTQVALNYEDAKAESIARHAITLETNAQYVD
jgi:hypothetical protein